MPTLDDDRLLDIRDVMERLGVDETTVRRMIARGELRGFRLGGRPGRPVRFYQSDIQKAVAGWRNR
jgi:excisionase family DNA binding protein